MLPNHASLGHLPSTLKPLACWGPGRVRAARIRPATSVSKHILVLDNSANHMQLSLSARNWKDSARVTRTESNWVAVTSI